MNDQVLTKVEFDRFRKYVYEYAGIAISDQKLTLVSNRIRRRLKATDCKSYTEYYNLLTSFKGASELPNFLDEITTNETYFLRDEHQYEWLQKEFVKPRLIEARKNPKLKSINIWSAACSTGEEPYSISISIRDQIVNISDWKIQIVATDLSNAALEKAKVGCYNDRSVKLCSSIQKKKYFKNEEKDKWILSDDIKKMVKFKSHNLLKPVSEGPFDCIFIKNVLIYFDQESKKIVVKHLLDKLAKGGYLVVGPSEGIYLLLSDLEKIKPWLYRKPSD